MKFSNAKTNPPSAEVGEQVSPSLPDQGPRDSRKVHVNGFPMEWTNEEFKSFFDKYVISRVVGLFLGSFGRGFHLL